jgi:hypothetical protein
MTRWLIAIILLLTLASCQTSTLPASQPTFVAHGQTYCAVHHSPLIKRQVFESGYITTGEYIDQACIDCDRKYPNYSSPILFSRYRTDHYNTPTVEAYCPLCERDFWNCARENGCDLTH